MKKGKMKKMLMQVIPSQQAKKDRDFKPAWKKDFVWLVYNETEGKNVLPVLCKFAKQ